MVNIDQIDPIPRSVGQSGGGVCPLGGEELFRDRNTSDHVSSAAILELRRPGQNLQNAEIRGRAKERMMTIEDSGGQN